MEKLFKALDFREIGVFNSREIAIFICAILFLTIPFVFNRSIRESIINVVKAFFAKYLVIVYILTAIYSFIPLAILQELGFLKISPTKDFLFWLFFSALPVLMSVNKAEKDSGFFKKVLKENIKFTVITDFITSQHTFNVFVEILLVISALFIGIMITLSEKEEKHKAVNKIFNVIALLLGIYVFSSSMYYCCVDIEKFARIEKFQEFSIPIILGIWFIPFLYCLYLYIFYENVFLSMKYSIKDENLLRYAKKMAFIKFNFNLSLLKRWKDSLYINEVKTKEDVLISMLDVNRLVLIERNPPNIDELKGWSPYKAKEFLNDKGIFTNHYKKVYEGEWQAISDYVDTDNEIIGNRISYYVVGNDSVAKELTLSLSVNSLANEKSAINVLLDCARLLYRKALSEELPATLEKCIYNKKNRVMKMLNRKVAVNKTDYQDPSRGYGLTFKIENQQMK